MKKILAMAIISLLCFSTFSMFSPSVHASVTVVSARLPSARTLSASIWDGNNAYIFGGGDASGPMNQILKYDSASDSISVMSAVLPYPAGDLCAVWSGQYAYIFGGAIYSPPFTHMIARYDPLTDSMTLISNTFPIYSMSAVWDGTCAYLFGGYDGYSYYDQILKYDPTNNKLTTMNAKMPIGIKWNSAVWAGNYAYIFGGNQYYDTPTDQILRYDPVVDSVTVVTAKLPEKVYFTSAVWTGTYAYVFGGNLDPTGATTDKIFKFDPALDECTSVAESLPSPRRGTSAIWDGQNAFIFGGDTWPPQVFLDEIVRFSPTAFVSLPWRDDFNYNTKDEMKAAGWTLDEEERISLEGGMLTLDNDGAHGCGVKYLGHFPSGIYDFSVEAKSKWIGRAYGQRVFYVWTQRHRYGWFGDGYYPEYSFIRYSDGSGGDDVKVLRFGGYAPVINEWATFALEKRGNTFYMYQDGELKNTYTETDSAPDELVAVSISGGWLSTMEYDYISVEAPPAIRAWKDDTSFGLENEHLLLHGGYNTYGGKIWFDYLMFKGTGTIWTSPWDDIFTLYSPAVYSADKATVQIAAFNYLNEAKLTYSADIPSSPWPHPPVHVELEIVIRQDSYIYWAAQVTNVGATEGVVPIGLTLYTFIAGDTANDYYYVPGHGQGQFIGTQQNINYDPSESWAAVWDEAKQEGCGIVTTQGFTDLNIQISDWYALTAVPEMVHLGEGLEGITLGPGESSPIYDCYYYYFIGTGWQKTKNFYDSVSPTPDFEISVSPEYYVADPHSTTEYTVNVTSLYGFNQPVTLSAIYSSHELSGSFEETVVTPPSGGWVTTTLTVSVLSEAINTHQIYVTGTSDTLSHTDTTSLHVPFMSVPYLSQGDCGWCLATSLTMAMDFWGKKTKPWETAESFGLGHDDGFDMHKNLLEIKSYISSQGLGYLVENALDEVRLESLLGYVPVILATNWTDNGQPAYHVVVVTGFYTDKFFINDPSGALLDEIFPFPAPQSHMQIEIPWTDLSQFIDFDRNPEAIGITGTGSINLRVGVLNLVGGKSSEVRTIKVDHEGIPGPYIWESGAKIYPGETYGITWQYGSHQRSLDPYDKLFIAKDLTDINDGLIVNPTSSWMDYEFHVIFEHPHYIYDRYCQVRVGPCSIVNSGFDTIDLGSALGSHYGQYQIILQLFDSEGLLIDEVDLPKINYRPFVRISVHSPVNLYVTDPQGLSIGTNPNTGELVNEVPDAFYSGPGTEPQVVMIPDPINGTYSIVLVGTATGSYTLTIEYITSEQTVTQSLSGTISEQEKKYYSTTLSETGEMQTVSWEYVFQDSRRGTMLKISTDDKYFQFIAPGKDFGIKHDTKMRVLRNIIIIRYEDEQMRLIATANCKIDFCSAIAWDKQTGKMYLLIDKPNWRFRRFVI